MRTLLIFLILLFACVAPSSARDIFEAGYNGSYVEDGFRPDTTVDAFTGDATINTRYQDEISSEFAVQNNSSGKPVYVAPIADIISKQTGGTDDGSANGDSEDANSENTKTSEEE